MADKLLSNYMDRFIKLVRQCHKSSLIKKNLLKINDSKK